MEGTLQKSPIYGKVSNLCIMTTPNFVAKFGKKKKRASNKTSITDINIVSISEVVPRLN